METTIEGSFSVNIDTNIVNKTTLDHHYYNTLCINFIHRFRRHVVDETNNDLTFEGLYPGPPLPLPQIKFDLLNRYEFTSPNHLFSIVNYHLNDPSLSFYIAHAIAYETSRIVYFPHKYLVSVDVVLIQDVFFLASHEQQQQQQHTRNEEEEDNGEDDETTCAICLDDLCEEMMKLPNCRHRFHMECIGEWLTDSNTCPLCRKIVFEEEVEF
ncbi:unnamed protein product [Cochlearia groenlandica]